jgi:hypothetical protein
MVLRLYYVGLLQDKRPEICPLFFQVDWAPSILRFIRRSEGEDRGVISVGCHGTLAKDANCVGPTVHHFFFLLSPVQPAVVLLQYAMKVRGERGFIIGYRYFEPSASSSIIVRNAVTVATAWIILGTVAALQHFTKVVYRLRGEDFGVSSILVVNEREELISLVSQRSTVSWPRTSCGWVCWLCGPRHSHI